MPIHWMTQRKTLLEAGAKILDQLAGSNSGQYSLAWRTWGEALLANEGWKKISVQIAFMISSNRSIDSEGQLIHHNLRDRSQMWVGSIVHVKGNHYKLIDIDGKLLHLNSEIDYLMCKEIPKPVVVYDSEEMEDGVTQAGPGKDQKIDTPEEAEAAES
jgi:hypothetical protein